MLISFKTREESKFERKEEKIQPEELGKILQKLTQRMRNNVCICLIALKDNLDIFRTFRQTDFVRRTILKTKDVKKANKEVGEENQKYLFKVEEQK